MEGAGRQRAMTEGSAQAIGGSLGPADVPGEQDSGAAIRAAAKQLSPIGPASREMSLMLAIPYPDRSRTGFEKWV
jgi:hypothetical protein